MSLLGPQGLSKILPVGSCPHLGRFHLQEHSKWWGLRVEGGGGVEEGGSGMEKEDEGFENR